MYRQQFMIVRQDLKIEGVPFCWISKWLHARLSSMDIRDMFITVLINMYNVFLLDWHVILDKGAMFNAESTNGAWGWNSRVATPTIRMSNNPCILYICMESVISWINNGYLLSIMFCNTLGSAVVHSPLKLKGALQFIHHDGSIEWGADKVSTVLQSTVVKHLRVYCHC